MRRARLAWLIFVSVVFLGVLGLWGRSFARNDTVFLPIRRNMLVVDSVRGEMSFWAGLTIRSRSGIGHEAFPAREGLRVGEVFERQEAFFESSLLGFHYAVTDRFPGGAARSVGLVRCLAVPYWFLALLTGLVPLRWAASRFRPPPAVTVVGRCRHCGSDRYEGEKMCRVCGEEM